MATGTYGKQVWKFDITTGDWTQMKNMTTARQGFGCSAYRKNGQTHYVLLAGGCNNLRSTEIYPISQDQEHKMVGNLGKSGCSQLISVGGKTTTIYAVGTGQGSTTNVEKWSHDQQTWAL